MKDKPGTGSFDTSEAAETGAALSLRTYFEEYKAEAKPPAPLLDRIMADAAIALPEAPPQRAWWQLPITGWASLATAALACVLWIKLPLTPPSPGGFGVGPTRSVPVSRREHTPAPHTPPPRTPQRTPPQRTPPPIIPGGTVKGSTSLQLLYSRKTSSGHTHKQEARSGVTLRAGDLVQLQYHTSKPAFVMVLSLNRKGEVSLFVPYGHSHSARISKREGYAPATGSLELDDYLGNELFFLLSSPKRFSVRDAKAAIKKAFTQRGKQWYHIRSLPGAWKARVIQVRKVK